MPHNKHFRTISRLISLSLVFVLISHSLPLHAIATMPSADLISEEDISLAGFPEGFGQDGTDFDEDSSVDEAIEAEQNQLDDEMIVGEMIEMRDEHTKHFRMADGTVIAAIYELPIHEMSANSQWVGIDASLVETAGLGSFETSQSIGLDSNASYDSKPNAIGERASFAKKPKEGRLLTIKGEQGIQMSWGLIGIDKKAPFAHFSDTEVPEKGKSKSSVKNISGTVSYIDIAHGITIDYRLVAGSIKEDIVLRDSSAKRELSFALDLKKLEATLEDGRIVIRKQGGEIFRIIEAPYMVDAAGSMSSDIAMTLQGGNGGYTVTVMPNEEWINDPVRVWPVTIDPTIQSKLTNTQIDSTSVCSKRPDSSEMYRYGSVWAGREASTYEQTKGVYRFELPTLKESDTVIGAVFSIAQLDYRYVSNSSMRLNLYANTKDMALSTLTWNKLSGNHGSTVIDTAKVSAATSLSYVNFDITKTVKEWYLSGNNYGVTLASESLASGDYRYAQFFTAWYPGAPALPVTTITYLNQAGLPSYLSTQSMGSPSMGAIDVVDANGNLVYTYTDQSLSGGYLPVEVAHVYNHSLRGNAGPVSSTSSFQSRGMRLNLDQRISTTSLSGYSLVWNDETGTVHYFKSAGSGVHKKEFDELVKITESAGTIKYTLTDATDITYGFNAAGWLVGITDTQSGKSATITRDTNCRITKIVDGSARTTTFNYDASGYLASLTDPAGRVTTYTYNANGCLTQITRPDNKKVTLTWQADTSLSTTRYILTKITDIDASAVTITYSAKNPRRVIKLSETGSAGAAGNTLSWTYDAGQTTITDSFGKNTSLLFDERGHTVCVRDGSGSAVYGSYNNTADNRSDTLASASTMQSSVTNYLTNPGTEGNSMAPWVYYGNTSSGTLLRATSASNVYSGEKALYLNATSAAGKVAASQSLTLPHTIAGRTYTLSAMVRTSSLTSYSPLLNSGLVMGATYSASSSPVVREVTEVLATTQISGWRRLSWTFTVDTAATGSALAVYVGLNNATGAVYVDDLQLESGEVANRHNYLSNGHFIDLSGTVTPAGWSGSNNSSGCSVATGRSGNGYKISGDATLARSIHQDVKYAGSAGDVFVAGAWAKAEAISQTDPNSTTKRRFGISIAYANTDGTTTTKNITFDALTAQWQYISGSATAAKPFSSVRVTLLYNYQANTATFDDVALYKDAFDTSNTYDSKGRLEKTVDCQGRTTTYAYAHADRSELSKIKHPDGTEQTYTYDSKWRLKSATDINGKTTTYTYDAEGNPTGSSMTIAGIKMTDGFRTFDSAGYLSKVNDQFAESTLCTYDATRGLLISMTDRKGTTTSYTYDVLTDAMLSAFSAGSKVTYDYVNDRLSEITHNTTVFSSDDVKYNLEYDQFGNRSLTKVGNNTLAANSYAPGNGNLIQTTYGNGVSTEYGYDSLDRLSTIAYNGLTTSYKWVYGADGRIGLHKDFTNAVNWRYRYTADGKPLTVSGNNGESFEYSYDEASENLTSEKVTVGSTSKTTTFTYGAPGTAKKDLLEKVTMPIGSVDYTYDDFYRPDQTVVSNNAGAATINQTYTYKVGVTTGNAMSRVATLTNTGGPAPVWSESFEYLYDKNGNITTIRKDSITDAGYSYDSQNRLIRENNVQANRTFTYSYDAAGNLTAVVEYPYTAAATITATALTTQAYSYSNAQWKDQLSSYDGNSITYDAIGNPLKYHDGKTFSWQRGRQLAKTVSGSNTTTYKYNAEGIRTQKTVNGAITTYTLSGDRVLKEVNGTDYFWFHYDGEGQVAGFNYNGAYYFYVRNLQGDVIAITNSSGKRVVEYVYNAWGRVISISGSSAATIGVVNPYRYRGYRYDTDSGLYYLNSRYYDPNTGRFINADGLLQTGSGGVNGSLNMYTYCESNPVMRIDPSGMCYYNKNGWWVCDNWVGSAKCPVKRPSAPKKSVPKPPPKGQTPKSINSTPPPTRKNFTPPKGNPMHHTYPSGIHDTSFGHHQGRFETISVRVAPHGSPDALDAAMFIVDGFATTICPPLGYSLYAFSGIKLGMDWYADNHSLYLLDKHTGKKVLIAK